ncbi:MAG: ABC transporter substrate-binding protein [Actinomycetota bacterium]|nr:ABC transporter substrate-binding protein [Actinomycetota bacterium]
MPPSTPRTAGRRPASLVVLPLVAGLLVLTSACGGSSKSSGSGSAAAPAGADAALFAKLPKDIQKSKVVRSVTDGTYPPNEFFAADGKTIQGFDIDLGNALGKKLGVTVQVDSGKFDAIITGIQGNRYDLALSSITDNKERQAKVDFVDYFTAGTSIVVKKGNPKAIKSLTDLCGKSIAVESGTTQVELASKQKCPAGQKITTNEFPTDTDALATVTNGRNDAAMDDFPVARYQAKQHPTDFEVVGEQYESAPYGIAVNKSLAGLRDAMQGALKAIIADGSYDQVLAKWDVSQGALKTASINAGS